MWSGGATPGVGEKEGQEECVSLEPVAPNMPLRHQDASMSLDSTRGGGPWAVGWVMAGPRDGGGKPVESSLEGRGLC